MAVFEDEIFQCQKHGEVPYKQWANRSPHDAPRTTCPRCDDELKAQRKLEADARLAEECRQRRIAWCRENSGLPALFGGASFEQYRISSSGQEMARNECQTFAKSLLSGTYGNRILIGKVGTGKTHLAAAIANTLIEAEYSAIYTRVRDLINDIRATWKQGSELSEHEVIKKYTGRDLLILDEVGVQVGTENERNILFDVIDKRYAERLPTIVISNLEVKGVSTALGERALDRLRDGGKVVTFDWGSHRGKE